MKRHFKHLPLRFTLINAPWWKNYYEFSFCTGFFGRARMAASITSLVRSGFVRTQEEFQYSKVLSFLLSSCETLAALSQYSRNSRTARNNKKKHLGRRTGKNTSPNQGYSMISNSAQAHNDDSQRLFFFFKSHLIVDFLKHCPWVLANHCHWEGQ